MEGEDHIAQSSISSSSSSSYYTILGVDSDSSIDEIRRAYRKLAMQWHPDKCTRTPFLQAEEAKCKFQQIQEAYQGGHFNGFSDFVQEMVSLMSQVSREEKEYSMEELQKMVMEMAGGFENASSWQYVSSSSSSSVVHEIKSQCSKRARLDSNLNKMNYSGRSHFHDSALHNLYETRGYCN
ncbi:Terminal organelle assembly protein [Senna tora]|uniref:Terminal organelle assembly protein n=1 Tax=Senna tora TaxID=362788 RepID=A0A834SRX9_9FABA|nr:Terminal organelle assembly protein [Senna tora]